MPNCVGRDAELKQLHETLQRRDGAVISAVSGMGGVGKTRLAIEYVTRHEQEYPGGVCWLKAREQDLAAQIIQFSELDLKLKELDDPRVKALPIEELVQKCWRHWVPDGLVLVVLDDVTDWAACQRFLPKQSRFRLLLTTRIQRLDAHLVEIPLDVLDPEDARDLLTQLERQGRVGQEPGAANELCEALGRLPLGIELVGQYLFQRRSLSLSKMLGELQTQKLACKALERETQYSTTAQLGVRAAFELTWQLLTEESRTVARLLSLFAPDAILWELVERMMQRVKGEEYEIQEARTQLENASVVQIVKENFEVCKLHPLIREFLREKQAIVVETTEERSLQDAYVSTLTAIASGMPSTPTTKHVLAFAPVRSHLQEVAERYPEELQGDDLLWVFNGLARFYEGQGLLAQAEPWYTDCLQLTQRLFEGDHREVALSLNNLASLYQAQGRYSEAEPLFQAVLAMMQRLFEGDHREVALSLNNLASLYHAQGRYSEAEPLFQAALAMRQRLFEGDHPDVALSLNNLAYLYQAQGRYSEAEPLYQAALAMRQRLFKGDHPDVALSLNNLAYLYQAQGRYSEAEPLYQAALAMTQRLFEGDHRDVALSLNNLASLYQAQGRHSEAEPLYQDALAMFQRTLGINHPNTQLVQHNLASLHQVMQSSPHPPRRRILLDRALHQIRRWIQQIVRVFRSRTQSESKAPRR
jgi:tetratricopeptide (TPR) repeat protein